MLLPRYPGLGNNDAVAAHADVVPNLHQIINLRTFADHGIAQSASIDSYARADFHFVLHDHPAELWNLVVAICVGGETKSRLADLCAGKDQDPIAEIGMGDRYIAGDLAILADCHARADNRVGTDARVVPIWACGPMTTPGPRNTCSPISALGSIGIFCDQNASDDVG